MSLLRLFQILENITENIEEIEEEFLVFRDLSGHPNIPEFFGLFLKRGLSSDDDQIWFVMEVRTNNLNIRNQTIFKYQINYDILSNIKINNKLNKSG